MADFKDPMSRTNSSQAMTSLFSAYADDDPDDDVKNTSRGSPVNDQAFAEPSGVISGSDDENIKSDSESIAAKNDDLSPVVKKPRIQPKVTKLVSYHDVDEVEDDDDVDDDESHDIADVIVEASAITFSATESATVSPAHAERSEDGDVILPPEPVGSCSRKLQEKVTKMYEKMRRTGLNINENIQSKKEFRNPSIYEKLIQFIGIDEKGTNYPPELFDPSIWDENSHYTELARLQKEEMEKKEKERKDKTKIEFVSGVKKGSDSSKLNERRSKWDTSQQVVTAAATGTKTTVISAVGTLKKSKS